MAAAGTALAAGCGRGRILALDFARVWQQEAFVTITDRDRRERVIKFTLDSSAATRSATC